MTVISPLEFLEWMRKKKEEITTMSNSPCFTDQYFTGYKDSILDIIEEGSKMLNLKKQD